jgi:hypothetical protein
MNLNDTGLPLLTDEQQLYLPERNTYFLQCRCARLEHLAQFSYSYKDWESSTVDPDRLTAEMYLSVHLFSWHNILRRIWIAIKYIFGYRCRYGEWDCLLLSVMDVIKLRRFAEQFLEDIYREDE